MNGPQDGLSIGELARQTGVPVATLRSWEDRYGFPRPQRLAGGHRRYQEGDAALIGEILRLRASGMSLQAAIGQAAARVAEAGLSVFAGVRRRHPGLVPQDLSKATLLAITRAMEDECCARAEHAALFAGFQQERFFRHSRERWKELARTAGVVVIFADFGQSSGPDDSPLTVRIPADAPLRREWFMVCAARDYPAFISGWEFPGQKDVPDARRRFEVLWSVDPPAVRDAALICAQVARTLSPSLDHLAGDLPAGAPPPASADLHRAIGLFNRMAGYLDKRTDR
ncbi:MAG: MerR family transcriptional regulator [Actinobacteria bacterium]|nr:MerR family transcriptional regulator [Actinomycetota bacterium]